MSLYDSYDPGSGYIGTSGLWLAQTFTTSAEYYIDSVKLYAYTDDTCEVTVSIKATNGDGEPTGDDLCTGTASLPLSDYDWQEITFDSFPLLNITTKYAIVVRSTPVEALHWGVINPGGYSDGALWYSADGTTWEDILLTEDAVFKTYGGVLPEKPINPIPANTLTNVKLSWAALAWESGS